MPPVGAKVVMVKKSTIIRPKKQYKKKTYYKKPYKKKLNYRSLRYYHFVRETLPDTKGFSIIPTGGGFNAIGYLNFDNLQWNQLVNSTTEFGALFARYKVSKIVTILTPMYQETVASNNNVGYSTSVGLRITRISTKYLNAPFAVQSNAKLQLDELAQIQSKTVRPYSSSRSMMLVTKHPGVAMRGIVDSTNTEIDMVSPCPWLNCSNQSDVPLKHNSLIFAERTDGLPLTADWKYRVVHKIYFTCTQVG